MSKYSSEYGLGGFAGTFAAPSLEPAANTVVQIPVDQLHEFHGHPFKVLDNEDMEALVQSIKENGVMEPITVRKDAKYGGYEIISGHRRTHACKRAGVKVVPAIVQDISDDEATIRMTDGNLHRSELLPSERAWSLKMRMDAIRHMHEENGDAGYDSAGQVASETEQSKSAVYKLAKLTSLNRELLQMADEKKLALVAAMDLSCLNSDQQNTLVEVIHATGAVPSSAQCGKLKKLSAGGSLTDENIHAVLTGGSVKQKGGKKAKKTEMAELVIKGKLLKTICRMFPECTNEKELKDALEKYLEKTHEQ